MGNWSMIVSVVTLILDNPLTIFPRLNEFAFTIFKFAVPLLDMFAANNNPFDVTFALVLPKVTLPDKPMLTLEIPKLNNPALVLLTTILPVLIVKVVPVTFALPVTIPLEYIFPDIPAPPLTINAPVVVLVLSVTALSVNVLDVMLLVIFALLAKIPVFDIVSTLAVPAELRLMLPLFMIAMLLLPFTKFPVK